MRILHFSDLHGMDMRSAETLIEELQPDGIVLTRDMHPDFKRLPGEFRRLNAEREWWQTWRSGFLRPGTPTMFVRGIHENEGLKAAIPRKDRSEAIAPATIAGFPIAPSAVSWRHSDEVDQPFPRCPRC